MWYQGNRYVIAGLEETLGMFAAQGVADFILDRIRGAPPEHKGHYINQLKLNPQATENDLITGVATALDSQKSFTPGPTMIENQIASLFPQHFQQWPLVYLRKMRLRPMGRDFSYRGFDDGSNDLNNQYYNLQSFFQQIADWATYSWQQDPRFQLAAYDFAQASSLTKDWHDTMAGLGAGKQYSPYLRDEEGNVIDDRIVYNYPDGWHVTQVISKNDLQVEGNKMHHCVGGYCHNVAGGTSRIFSLRDPRNHPVATIEMDGRGNFVKQIKAEFDEKPPQEIRLRLAEWFSDMGDVEWADSGSSSWEPYWDSDPESLRGAIYDEAYGRQDYDDDDGADSEDFHDDYGIGGGNDYSRNVRDLGVPELLDSVESHVAPNRGQGTFDRIRNTIKDGHKWYSEEEHVAEPLASVIVAHDEALLKDIIQEKSEENEWTPERKRWTPDRIRNHMGVFDVARAYVDKHESLSEEAFEEDLDESGKYNEHQLAEDDDSFRLYYLTMGTIRDMLGRPGTQNQFQQDEQATPEPTLVEMYQQLAGSNLVEDLNWTTLGSLRSIQTREEQERNQPKLMKHKEDYTRQSLPRLEDGMPDEGLFDEGGWKYAKRRVDWYRFVNS